ncbi:UDP-4-amino-4,6-dideoxy-N-acetyl-beta-L-altrosamine transaminase [Blastomonas marina]|uniref:UDP-4-amino-4, 6-dideoxy-N-acetyl-beta-L-altrosamine transaminase n=1 Tax=Blastomonas marina TaxID=1867408 RepID=A0ABQ1FH43_9SPHN|nr:UDP-4-amino-4,6-dideoxy-N-acetyl-beta-L-altrosamine transaminase [Blastomonas marina]GGA11870.1 UDP-4-amino-4,6-dideoxy-N-acetyl-beta-L-altrosamine transaminase [Blastomonas marina]
MAFIPYSRQQIEQADIDAVVEVLQSDFLTQGPAIERFEKDFAERHQVAHAVALSNATAALHIACLALGVGQGSRVWTSPNSFVASANCALYCGAEIDFVDIDPDSRNMSVERLREKLEGAKAEGTLPDVVIPVDFSGMPCDLEDIRALADEYGFRILQDASHATGAEYQGKPVGGQYADASVFSFHAVKIVTSAEGGMVTTQDAELAKKIALLRSHGVTRDADLLEHAPEGGWYYEQVDLGYNYRITDVQAALGASQLERIDTMQAERAARADRYDEILADLPLKLPKRFNDRSSAWHLYVVELTDEAKCDRATLFAAMREAGIGVNVHYIPIHTQPHYERLGFARGDFPAAEAYYDRAITIPLFPAMTDEEQDRVAQVIREHVA